MLFYDLMLREEDIENANTLNSKKLYTNFERRCNDVPSARDLRLFPAKKNRFILNR